MASVLARLAPSQMASSARSSRSMNTATLPRAPPLQRSGRCRDEGRWLRGHEKSHDENAHARLRLMCKADGAEQEPGYSASALRGCADAWASWRLYGGWPVVRGVAGGL